ACYIVIIYHIILNTVMRSAKSSGLAAQRRKPGAAASAGRVINSSGSPLITPSPSQKSGVSLRSRVMQRLAMQPFSTSQLANAAKANQEELTQLLSTVCH